MDSKNKILSLILAITLLVVPTAVTFAATTIGNNVSVGGTLGSTGLTTLTGGFISNASSSVGASLNINGSLAIGLAPTGAALLMTQATSTTATSLVLNDDAGNQILKFSSTTASIIDSTGKDIAVNTDNLVVGAATGNSVGGMVTVRSASNLNGAGFTVQDTNGRTASQLLRGRVVVAINGSTTSTYAMDNITFNQSNGAALGTFYVDSSGNVSASGSLRINQAGSTTTTINVGNLGSAGSKACFNTQTAVGTQASFYISAAGTMVVELNACK